jgi:7,8-dihydropterin-6-yl-methyl-4-(beta-D-ribofuranosyl)aminobenzene 5'-phosphate synthase
MRWLLAVLLLSSTALAAPARVHELKVTVLSTMLADEGVGEWGWAALVEADGRTWLFDTGARPGTVLENARQLKVDLSRVTDVIVSHNHGDHTGGLVALRKAMAARDPRALAVAHIGRGALWSRPSEGGEQNQLLTDRATYERLGGHFVEHSGPVELAPGVWLTGPVPRIHDERNWSQLGKVLSPTGLVEDNVPEDQSLVFDTERGLVLLSGCGHAGFINTADYARKIVREAPLVAAIGGFHLFPLDDARLTWTIRELQRLGLEQFLGGHCTGLEAVYRIRAALGLPRSAALVAAVGSSFTLGKGIDPLRVAR